MKKETLNSKKVLRQIKRLKKRKGVGYLELARMLGFQGSDESVRSCISSIVHDRHKLGASKVMLLEMLVKDT